MYHDHLGRFSGANGVRGALQACTRVRDLRMCCFLGANMSPESTEMFGSSIMLVKQSQITHILGRLWL